MTDADGPGATDALDALFGGPPDEFVAARDRLAAALRASGQPDAAATVKRLRRPTLAAWSLNRVALEEPAVVGEFVDASRALRDAQARSDDPGVVRDAIARHRTARRAVVDAALDQLGDTRSNRESVASEIATTLDAAALDDAVAAALAAGRLERAATASSAFDVLLPDAPRASTTRSTREGARTPSTRGRAAREAADAGSSDDGRARARDAEREAARDAKILAAAARVDEAARAVDQAHDELAAADAELRRLTKEVEAARKARDDAQRRLDRAEDARARAQAAYDRI